MPLLGRFLWRVTLTDWLLVRVRMQPVITGSPRCYPTDGTTATTDNIYQYTVLALLCTSTADRIRSTYYEFVAVEGTLGGCSCRLKDWSQGHSWLPCTPGGCLCLFQVLHRPRWSALSHGGTPEFVCAASGLILGRFLLRLL